MESGVDGPEQDGDATASGHSIIPKQNKHFHIDQIRHDRQALVINYAQLYFHKKNFALLTGRIQKAIKAY